MKSIVHIFTVVLSILILSSGHAEAQKKTNDLSYYRWYGKRFDWILDLYGGHPFHKDSIHLFISEIGNGKDTFLVIHGGFGSEHSYLLDALLPLADNVHFIFYDQRGSLRSPCPDSLLSLESQISDIERIRKAMKMEHINIIAHSMGTFLAMDYLQKFPGKAGNVILISSLPVNISTEEEKNEYYNYQHKYFESTYKDQPKLWLQALKKKGYDTSTYGRRSLSQSSYLYMQQFWAAVAKVKNLSYWDKDDNGNTFLYKSNVGAVIFKKDMPAFWDFRTAMQMHPFPITIIKPSSDYLSPEIVKRSVQGIFNVKYVQIGDCGHNLWLEQPDKFRMELKRAIRSK